MKYLIHFQMNNIYPQSIQFFQKLAPFDFSLSGRAKNYETRMGNSLLGKEPNVFLLRIRQIQTIGKVELYSKHSKINSRKRNLQFQKEVFQLECKCANKIRKELRLILLISILIIS